MEFELGVIEEMGFPAYFLIVWDFGHYAKENGIAVGNRARVWPPVRSFLLAGHHRPRSGRA
ncbi:MAG: hypothetical protein H6532_03435 [Thermoleophilales bacterium]|nr:hypothetical protein [Thermoleophilales bacterium]